MATDLENLKAIRTALISQKLTIAQAGPKLTYKVDGQTMNWTEYMKYLSDEIAKLDLQIAADEPAYVVSQVIV